MSTPRQAVVIGGEIVAPGVRRVRFRMAGTERLGHRAGQYVLLHARAGDGSVVKRAYSIATPTADDPEFELCARLIIDQPASTFVHGLAAGDAVKFSGPWGKFVVDDETRDLTLAATGTAISCTGAILRDELARARPRRVRLLWGLRHETDAHGAPMLEELARALLHDPRLLLMDEPTVGLDPASRRALLAYVHELCRGRNLGVLWATHLVDEAEAADRVVVLHQGRVRCDGLPADLLAKTGQRTLADAFIELTATRP